MFVVVFSLSLKYFTPLCAGIANKIISVKIKKHILQKCETSLIKWFDLLAIEYDEHIVSFIKATHRVFMVVISALIQVHLF